MKDSIGWNVWMKLIPKQLCRIKATRNVSKLQKTWNIWMNVEHEWTFGWQLEVEKLLRWNFRLVECMNENNSKTNMTNGNY
jgi:hypothetical protein